MPHECTTCGRQFDDGSKEMLSGCPNCGGNKFQFQPGGSNADGASSAASDAGSDDGAPSPADETAPNDADEVAEADVEQEMPELAKDDQSGSSTDSGFAERAKEFHDAEIDDEVGDENTAQSDARSSSASIDEIDQARRKMAEAEEERLSEAGSGGRGTPQGPPTEGGSGGDPEEFDISGAVGPDDDDHVERQPVAGSAPEREEPAPEEEAPEEEAPEEEAPEEEADLSALREELNDQFESIKITAPGQYELNLMELYDRKEYIISLQEDGRYVIEMADDYGMEQA